MKLKLPSGFEEAQGEGLGPDEGAQIVTFYSYKGGVGRSMALANVAVMLARDYDLDVIAVDWDLEAPGLHRFFGIDDKEVGDGLVEYFYRYREMMADPRQEINDQSLSVLTMLITVLEFPGGGRVRLLPAGDLSNYGDYARRATEFDWVDFYRNWSGAQLIEHLRNQLKRMTSPIDRPDQGSVVLVDSRTGITDIGGICTLQLPDTVVLVFAFNEQNIMGIDHIAGDLNGENAVLKELGRRPRILLLPSRKDVSEIRSLLTWEEAAAKRLGPHVGLEYSDALAYIRDVAVPYVPYFAYGEEIAALVREGVQLTPSLQKLTGTLVGESLETRAVERLSQQLEEARTTIEDSSLDTNDLKQLKVPRGGLEPEATEEPVTELRRQMRALRIRALTGAVLVLLMAIAATVAFVVFDPFDVLRVDPTPTAVPAPTPITAEAATATPGDSDPKTQQR